MNTKALTLLALLGAACSSAFAHDGHGLTGAHWHATDALGFVAAAVGLGVAIWLGKGGK